MRRVGDSNPDSMRASQVSDKPVRIAATGAAALSSGSVRQQAVCLALDDLITLAGSGQQAGTVKQADAATTEADQSQLTQYAGCLADAFPAHAQYARNTFLRDWQTVARR